jgi:hypothetical protein
MDLTHTDQDLLVLCADLADSMRNRTTNFYEKTFWLGNGRSSPVLPLHRYRINPCTQTEGSKLLAVKHKVGRSPSTYRSCYPGHLVTHKVYVLRPVVWDSSHDNRVLNSSHDPSSDGKVMGRIRSLFRRGGGSLGSVQRTSRVCR